MADNTMSSEVVSNFVQSTSSSDETMVFNIGGTTFETYRSTLLRVPNSPLTNRDFLEDHFRGEKNDYFFDMDADAFKITLNYLRTGQVHIPSIIDRPSLRNDLQFWGITSSMIQQIGSTVQQRDVAVSYRAAISDASTPQSTRQKTWDVLSNPVSSLPAKIYAAFTYFLIFVSVFIMVFETTKLFLKPSAVDKSNVMSTAKVSGHYRNHIAVYIILLCINVFFTVEYIVRVIVAPNRLKFIISLLGMIDLMALPPDYILLILYEAFDIDNSLFLVKLFHIWGVFRILRVLRVFKHFKNLINLKVFVDTFKASVGELVLIVSLFAVGTLVSSTVCYFIESGTEYSHFRNIPEASYWAIITMTTVGYGDMRPVTPLGKVLSAITALYGIIMIGFLVSSLLNNFVECSKKIRNKRKDLNMAHGYTDNAECQPLTLTCTGGQCV